MATGRNSQSGHRSALRCGEIRQGVPLSIVFGHIYKIKRGFTNGI